MRATSGANAAARAGSRAATSRWKRAPREEDGHVVAGDAGEVLELGPHALGAGGDAERPGAASLLGHRAGDALGGEREPRAEGRERGGVEEPRGARVVEVHEADRLPLAVEREARHAAQPERHDGLARLDGRVRAGVVGDRRLARAEHAGEDRRAELRARVGEVAAGHVARDHEVPRAALPREAEERPLRAGDLEHPVDHARRDGDEPAGRVGAIG